MCDDFSRQMNNIFNIPTQNHYIPNNIQYTPNPFSRPYNTTVTGYNSGGGTYYKTATNPRSIYNDCGK